MMVQKEIVMPEGFILRAFDVLDSTNAECRRIADEGAAGNIWVTTTKQTAGKGRRGREWVSRPGNLFASLLYRIECDLEQASQLSFVTALAVRDVIADILQCNDRVTCKWPNDILVEGKKISGILLETAGADNVSPSHVVIGIGVNVAHHPETAQYPATDISKENNTDPGTNLVLQGIITSMDYWIHRWQEKGFSHIRKMWMSRAQGLGQTIIVRLPNEEIQGCFIDLDDKGALILESEAERRHITAGDVFFV